MLTNIAVLRTVKENANKAVLDALPSILFEGSHNGKDAQKYYLQGPAAEYVPVNIPDETAKKFSQCATALAMQLILLSNKTKGFFGPEIVSVEGKDIPTARNIMNPIMVERNAKYYSAKLSDEVYDTQYAVSEHVIECWEDGPVPPIVINTGEASGGLTHSRQQGRVPCLSGIFPAQKRNTRHRVLGSFGSHL